MRPLVIPLMFGACSDSIAAPPSDASQAAAPVHTTVTLSGSFGVTNPCNGDFVTGATEVTLAVNQVDTPNGASVVVRRTVRGTLSGTGGQTYELSSQSVGHFDAMAASYELPHRSTANAAGSELDFSLSGMVRVNVSSSGTPTGSTLLSLNLVCSAS
jgi:hypothetical protein